MSRRYIQNPEDAKIDELARKYQRKGYEVQADLHGYEQPDLIGGYRPDLIVKKGGETIVIEVKSSSSIRSTKDSLSQLARHIEGLPGVRFDLVLTNPKASSSVYTKIETLEVALSTLLDGLLEDIKEAISHNKFETIPILSVRILEGLFSRLAIRESVYVPPRRWNLNSLATALSKERVISPSVRKFAERLYESRNAILYEKGEYKAMSYQEAIETYERLDKLIKEWGGVTRMTDEVICPVCHKAFNSYLNLARHMVLKDRPSGEHIQWLEDFLDKPFVEFGWKSDKRIANALRHAFSQKKVR